MADTADDLSAPLGQNTERRKRRFRLPFTAMQALAVLLGLFLVAFVGFALFNNNPLGGEPVAQVAIQQKRRRGEGRRRRQPTSQGEKAAPKQAEPGEHKTVTIIDGSSGKRQDVVIGGGDAPGKTESEAAAAPAMMTGIDPRLLEKSRYGMIPMVADGPEAIHRLCGRRRPRQGGEDADGRHRRRRPRRWRGEDDRSDHEAAAAR